MTALLAPSAFINQTFFDQLIDPANLMTAWKKVRSNQGSHGGDNVSWQRYEKKLEKNLDNLYQDLQSGEYQPGRLRKVRIKKPKGGYRKLLIPPVRDRIAQGAATQALVPMLDGIMSDNSFAYRPGRSVDMALYQAQNLMIEGYVWVVDLDIKQFFDRIPHQRLMMELAIWVNDDRFLTLAGKWLKSFSSWKRGIAQGAPISPLFANLYMHPVDRILSAAGINAIRYADDILLFCETRDKAEKTMTFMESMILGRGLALNKRKSKIHHASQHFSWLGQDLGGQLLEENKPVLLPEPASSQSKTIPQIGIAPNDNSIPPEQIPEANESDSLETTGAGLELEDHDTKSPFAVEQGSSGWGSCTEYGYGSTLCDGGEQEAS